MTRTEERGRAILELFAEAQRLVDLDNRLTRLTEIERHRKTEVANRYHKPAAMIVLTVVVFVGVVWGAAGGGHPPAGNE